jgi:hypothetical protein
VICGKRRKTGRDHIPPKSVFPKPCPSDLITVSACDQCNNGSSELDEEFIVSVALEAAHGSDRERPFCERASRSLGKNKRLCGELASTMREVEIQTTEGLITAHEVLLKSKSYDTVIDRIIRGIHFHHTGHILGDKVDVKVNWLLSLPNRIYEMTKDKDWGTGVVGGDQFVYKYLYFYGVPLASLWVLQFFGRVWYSGKVTPKKRAFEQQNGESEEGVRSSNPTFLPVVKSQASITQPSGQQPTGQILRKIGCCPCLSPARSSKRVTANSKGVTPQTASKESTTQRRMKPVIRAIGSLARATCWRY